VNELQDLKNYIQAIQQQINNLTNLLQIHTKKDDNLNEILNLIHNQNFEKVRFNQILFENIFPDLVRRISTLEDQVLNNRQEQFEKDLILNKSISSFKFPTRVINQLKHEGVKTLKELLNFSSHELLKMPNISFKSVNKIQEVLKDINFKLRNENG
jgi:serine phosphatase RsbU (regulator of sigma subunit)